MSGLLVGHSDLAFTGLLEAQRDLDRFVSSYVVSYLLWPHRRANLLVEARA